MYANGKLWPRWYDTKPLAAAELLPRVAEEFGTTPCEIKGPVRVRELMGPRVVVARILRERGLSLPTIGRILNRDHSSVRNCLEKFDIYARFDDRVTPSYERWKRA